MRAILSTSGVGLVLLAELLREEDALKALLLSADLASEEGLAKARTVQGQAKGISRAIDIVFDIANLEDGNEH